MPLQRALFALIGTALIGGLVPGAIVLDRRLAGALEERARADLSVTPMVLADREAMSRDAMAMHARELARTSGLSDALARSDTSAARSIASSRSLSENETPVLVTASGLLLAGPASAARLAEVTQDGGVAVAVVGSEEVLARVALAPVVEADRWIGAAGVASPLDRASAGTLAGLTRSEVTLLAGTRSIAASTDDASAVAAAIADSIGRWRGDHRVHELRTAEGRRYLVACAELGTTGTVVFARDLEAELAVLPRLRRVAGVAGGSALLLALLFGGVLATVLARPVRSLARAADRLSGGDFEAPLDRSIVREVDRLALAFDEMRETLATRLRDLESANRALEDRQERLTALQAELIQRDRLAASGRLVTELAHEIRNPVANVQNCVEVVRRRLTDDPIGREFADLAIDELLRMHELAERMLDLHRPGHPDERECDPFGVVSEVASLVKAGAPDGLEIEVDGEPGVQARIAPDALKQILLNLVQNARDAVGDRGRIELQVGRQADRIQVEVLDDGPGIAEELIPKVFDPFFTTKPRVQGVGLGLFVAQGIVSAHGGRIVASNRTDGRGASFRLELQVAPASRGESASG